MTTASSLTLFGVFAGERPFTLWYRPRRGAKWQPIHAGFTERECDAMTGSTLRHGQWITLPAGAHPEDRKGPR